MFAPTARATGRTVAGGLLLRLLGLAVLGALWMILSAVRADADVLPTPSPDPAAASPNGPVGQVAGTVGQTVGQATGAVDQTVGQVAGAVDQTVGPAAQGVGGAAGAANDQAQQATQQAAGAVDRATAPPAGDSGHQPSGTGTPAPQGPPAEDPQPRPSHGLADAVGPTTKALAATVTGTTSAATATVQATTTSLTGTVGTVTTEVTRTLTATTAQLEQVTTEVVRQTEQTVQQVRDAGVPLPTSPGATPEPVSGLASGLLAQVAPTSPVEELASPVLQGDARSSDAARHRSSGPADPGATGVAPVDGSARVLADAIAVQEAGGGPAVAQEQPGSPRPLPAPFPSPMAVTAAAVAGSSGPLQHLPLVAYLAAAALLAGRASGRVAVPTRRRPRSLTLQPGTSPD